MHLAAAGQTEVVAMAEEAIAVVLPEEPWAEVASKVARQWRLGHKLV